MSEDMKLTINSSPQIHAPSSTAKIMWIVVLSLIPAGVWGVYAFGARSLVVLAAAVAGAVVSEWLMCLVFRKKTLADGSAVLTGLLVGYNMPAEVPVFIAVLASVFAIVIVKWTFGGLGTNWMNPALAGRVFVFFSWTGGMSRWVDASYGPRYRLRRKSARVSQNQPDGI